MKKINFVSLIVLVLYNFNLSAQIKQNDIKLNYPQSLKERSNEKSLNCLQTISLLFPFNPILLIENKKFYAGITKEFSAGLFPYGRVAAEYSLIFRNTNLNQLRFSYNFDIPVESGDFAIIFISLGGGYFTDFSKHGYFPQASFSVLIPASEIAVVNAYFKVRNSFVSESQGSDVFDVSFGLATVFYF